MSSTATATQTVTPPDTENNDDNEQQVDDDDDTLTTTQSTGEASTSILVTKILIILLSIANYAYLVFYYGWVWLMLKFPYQYTQWTGMPIPGILVDQRYNFYWVVLIFMMFQIFPALSGLWLLKSPANWARQDVYRNTSAIASLVVLACFLIMFFWVWFFQTNNTYYPFSIANSVDFCCKYWGTVTSSLACSNTGNCIDEPLPGDIHVYSNQVFRYLLWGFFFILLFNMAHFFLSAWNRHYVSAALDEPDRGASVGLAPNNRYSKSGVIAIHVFNGIFIILMIFYFLFGPLTLDVRYTHEYPAPGPFDIRSARSGFGVVGLVFCSTVIFTPLFVLLTMLAEGKKYALVTMVIAFVVLFMFHAVGLASMFMEIGDSNAPGRPNNLANHPLRCCSPDVYNDVKSECDNTIGCTLPFDGFPSWTTLPTSYHSVPGNPVFKTMMIIMVFLVLLDIVLAILVFVTYLGRSILRHAGKNVSAKIESFVDMVNDYIDAPIKKLIQENNSQPVYRGEYREYTVPQQQQQQLQYHNYVPDDRMRGNNNNNTTRHRKAGRNDFVIKDDIGLLAIPTVTATASKQKGKFSAKGLPKKSFSTAIAPPFHNNGSGSNDNNKNE